MSVDNKYDNFKVLVGIGSLGSFLSIFVPFLDMFWQPLNNWDTSPLSVLLLFIAGVFGIISVLNIESKNVKIYAYMSIALIVVASFNYFNIYQNTFLVGLNNGIYFAMGSAGLIVVGVFTLNSGHNLPVTPRNLNFCTKCSTKNDWNTQFCTFCGNDLRENNQSINR